MKNDEVLLQALIGDSLPSIASLMEVRHITRWLGGLGGSNPHILCIVLRLDEGAQREDDGEGVSTKATAVAPGNLDDLNIPSSTFPLYEGNCT